MLGNLFGKAVRIVNAPIRTVEDLLGVKDDEDRLISIPGDKLAEELEKVDGDD